MLLAVFVVLGIFLVGCNCETSSKIPDILVNCYEKNYTDNAPKPPLTIKLFVELIRKLEFDKSEPNIRSLTKAILHTIKLDGIQRTGAANSAKVIPYRALGKQFYKFKTIVDHLTPGDSLQFPKESINLTDLCILHAAVSNTIDLWPRGDEKHTCQQVTRMARETDDRTSKSVTISDCPIERGVLKSRYGTISPGHLVAGIASAFENENATLAEILDDIGVEPVFGLPNNDKYKDDLINNILVSTIIGDLAEVFLNQANDETTIGKLGYWNDTLLPRDYYLTDNYWDLSGAELLGGIDGLILAYQIKRWTGILDRFRFSQLVDMYYSERGIGFDKSFRACERTKRFKELLSTIGDLENETKSTAKLLRATGNYDYMVTDGLIDEISTPIISNYYSYAKSFSANYDACEQGGDNIGPLEIIVILDETYDPYEAETFLAYLSELTDISYYGSKIGVINGQTGAWLTNITSDLVQLYSDLSNRSDWPTTLSLTRSLHSVISYYQNKTTEQCDPYKRPYGHIVLVMAHTARINDIDYANVLPSIESIKFSNPEANLIYVTTGENAQLYEGFAKNHFGNDVVLKSSQPEHIDSVVKQISEKLSRSPANIINFYCDLNATDSKTRTHANVYEDYITPGLETFYEIHHIYLNRASIKIQFKGHGYGDILICIYDIKSKSNKSCKGIDQRTTNEASFNIQQYCNDAQNACTIQFEVTANNSTFKCAELECRYPDQVRLDIRTEWVPSNSYKCNVNVYLLFTLLNVLLFNIK